MYINETNYGDEEDKKMMRLSLTQFYLIMKLVKMMTGFKNV